MDLFNILIDFVIHLDKHIIALINFFGMWSYLLLSLVFFIETGLVIMPFLPGDSLLFIIGALCANGVFNTVSMYLFIMAAVLLGDTTNYCIGKSLSNRLHKSKFSKFIKQEHLDKTYHFYQKHGGKTIILARYVPIVRTFAPFVAGLSGMDYARFIKFSVAGGITWVTLFLTAGYLFGNIPAVEENLTYVIFAIIFISIIPAAVTYIKDKMDGKKDK